jgi:FAD/FMN-containing dehydrogenase
MPTPGSVPSVADMTAEAGTRAEQLKGVPMSLASNPSTISIRRRLGAAVDGRVIVPGDPGYDQAPRVFYGGFDRRPAVIVRPADASEVAAVVALAGDSGLELAVRGGGHGLAGHSTIDGGILLDLAGMQRLVIDPPARTAWAQTGLTAAAYTTRAHAYGLATGFGDTGSVGIGGLTLGGGGGNFGVATRLQFRLHELRQIVGRMLLLPATPEVVAAVVAEAEAAPEELSAIAHIMKAPPMPPIPAPAHGKPVVMALLCWAGDLDAGERVVARFRGLATPSADLVRPMPDPEIYRFTEGPGSDHEAGRSLFLDAVDLPTATTILDRLGASTAPLAVAQLRLLGGAMARVPADATTFAHRTRPILAGIGAVREAYPGPTWERLAAIKRRYDPGNLFHRNQNIPPATQGVAEPV